MRVQIYGARRIWIMVKREYKTACDNHAVVKKWWFILRGSEERLQQLENEWEPVPIHTSWKIELAYYFICDADEQHGSDKECA